MTEKTYPVAEIFTSPQGEGHWAGVLCTFVRLAGCNVGKPYSTSDTHALGLQIYQEKCTLWNGQSFPCDTDYKMRRRMTIAEIMNEVGDVPRMLLTGGEPLMHDVKPLLRAAFERGKFVHIETSGTKRLGFPTWGHTWIAVSPKQGCLPEMLDVADEIRILVGADFDEAKFVKEFGGWFIDTEPGDSKVFISAINDEHTLNMDNIKRCLALQLKYPQLRISTQVHKILGVR